MKNKEIKKDVKAVSEYIDALAENKSVRKGGSPSHREDRLMRTARLIHDAYTPAMPEPDYHKRLAANIRSRLLHGRKAPGKRRFAPIAAIGTAAVLTAVLLLVILPLTGINPVSAMERAYERVKAYHGILEVTETNALGESMSQARLEVWADTDGRYHVSWLDGRHKGLVTVNNGRRKWQIQPETMLVQLFTAFPDPNRFTFELGREVELAKAALEVSETGTEILGGRPAVIYEITPQGGSPYRIWVDRETNLPLQKQSSFQNALQYRMAYTEIEFHDEIPPELLVYTLPAGYREIYSNPVQILESAVDLRDTAGFDPSLPGKIPDGYRLDYMGFIPGSKTIQSVYVSNDESKRVIILQGRAAGEFRPASTAVLGTVGSAKAELQSPVFEDTGILPGGGPYAGITGISSIRWQDGGYEYAVVGDASIDDLELFVYGVAGSPAEFPEAGSETPFKPEIVVPVDMEIERNEQESVDAGHSPWRLDPLFVSQVFVSLEMFPGGITGDYPVDYEDLKLVWSDGIKAVVEVEADSSPVRRVYLERLVRQDPTGIWTVIGYDRVR